MLETILQILVAVLLTYFFIKKEKPKTQFLVYGYVFFFVALILQLPLRLLEIILKEHMNFALISTIGFTLVILAIAEITKYFSLKRFLKTRSLKNGILFGIGWSTVESISIFSLYFYTFIFSLFSISFNYSNLLSPVTPLFSFIFFFVVNLGITVLVIFSVIKKKVYYLLYAIFLQLILHLGLLYLEAEALAIFITAFFFYGLYLLFRYRTLKKR